MQLELLIPTVSLGNRCIGEARHFSAAWDLDRAAVAIYPWMAPLGAVPAAPPQPCRFVCFRPYLFPMPSSSQSLTDLQQSLVEEFGTLYESYGFKRLKGLIVGLVLTQSAPVSLDDITDLLGRSKGPISSAVRELASIGIIRKVNGPVARRDYYEADENLFYNNFRHNMDIVRKNRRIAERYLQRIPNAPAGEEGTSPADYTAMKANMEQMHAFYTLMESFYADFSERWAEVRSQEFGTEAVRNE